MIIHRKDGFYLSDKKEEVDFNKLHNYLSLVSYWRKGISIENLKTALEHSTCFSIFSKNKEFVGFARVITDYSTFAYLSDVYIEENFRGFGLGKWLISNIMEYPEFKGVTIWTLFTKDAHGLYEKFGWKSIYQDRIMVKKLEK